MKKVISLLLASAMIAGLTACGGSGSSSASSEPAAETAEGGEATEGTEAAASGDAVEIKIWQPTDKEAVENWWTEKIAAWNAEHPEIQVSREAIDRSDSYAYDNKVATAVTSNDLPDILFVDRSPTMQQTASSFRSRIISRILPISHLQLSHSAPMTASSMRSPQQNLPSLSITTRICSKSAALT